MKVKVLSKKHIRSNGKKEDVYYTYFTPVMIHVIDENGNDLGEQKKNLNVHFTKIASRKLPDEKVFAIIGSSKSEDIQLPFIYRIPKDKEDQEEWQKNDCWIRDFETFDVIPYKAQESTCNPILDEEETEPVEIVEEN